MSFVLNKKFLFSIAILALVFITFASTFTPEKKDTAKEGVKKEKIKEINGHIPQSQQEREEKGWNNVPNPDELDKITREEYGGGVVGISYWTDKATGVFYARVELALDGAPFAPYAYYKNSEGKWSEVDEKDLPADAKNLF